MDLSFYSPDHKIPEPHPGVPLWTLYKDTKCFDAELRSWSDGGCEVQFSCNGQFLYSYRHANPALAIGHAAGFRIELEASGWRADEPRPAPTTRRRHPARQRRPATARNTDAASNRPAKKAISADTPTEMASAMNDHRLGGGQ